MNTEDLIYIGVDGGGTKTAIGAYDARGHCVVSTISPPLNYHVIGVDAALTHLMDGVSAMSLSKERIAAVGIGDPANDDVSDSESARHFAASVRQRLGVPVYIRSDAYMTLYGLTRGEAPGVLIISGTGAMAIAEDAQKRIFVAGGWGRLTGDEGSGYFIGLQGLRAALHAADGIAPSTALTEAALHHFHAPNARALIDVFYGTQEPDVAGFSRVVGECAEGGDAAARNVLWEAARYLADYVSVLIGKSGADTVGVYGSVLTKNRIVRKGFEELLHERYSHIRVTEPPISAQAAAALYAEREFLKEVKYERK